LFQPPARAFRKLAALALFADAQNQYVVVVKALIKVGYGCNDHCSFCHTLDVRHVDGEAAEVHAKIRRAKELGHTMVVLSGGEPTIRPELLAWASHVAELDMDFGLVTNGRMLAYAELVEQLLERRLRYVYLSLHGGSAKIHNLLVRSHAFEETYGALANLSGRGLDLSVNCVVTKQNVNHLRALVDACLPYPDAKVKLSMVEPKGGGDKLFARLMPRVSEVAERVRDALDHAASKGQAHRFTHGAIPLCLLPGWERGFDDLKTHRFATMTEVGEPDFYPVDALNKVQPAPCEGCSLRGPCPGLYRGYHEVFGHAELEPVREAPRSNSFNYTFVRLVAKDAPEDRCLLKDGTLGVTPWERGRHLFVRNGERQALYRADTRDFSDAEVAAIKHDAGQVYFDASRKAAPDDFAKDLVKLRRSALCDGCPHRPSCSGVFEPVYEDVFTRDDAEVRVLLEEATGAVLDLGCGEGPYAELLAERVAAGAIDYVGVDPDERAVASLREAYPWAELHVAGAEDLSVLGDRRFDHVFVLRSWNHLRDPAKALEELRRHLAPGATITVVDNVAFGLARTSPQTQRAESGPSVFEHYRNDSATDAARHLEAHLDLALDRRRDVGPATSNQWLLRYRLT